MKTVECRQDDRIASLDRLAELSRHRSRTGDTIEMEAQFPPPESGPGKEGK
jgi:hypothetical protein